MHDASSDLSVASLWQDVAKDPEGTTAVKSWGSISTWTCMLRMQAWRDVTEMRKHAGKIKVNPYVAAWEGT